MEGRFITICVTLGVPIPRFRLVNLWYRVMYDRASQWRFAAGISGIISLWLNKEWTTLGVHKDVGTAAANAYIGARNRGAHDMGDLVLELSSQLTSFDFDETFVGMRRQHF